MKIQFFKKNNTFKKKNFGFNTSLYWDIILFIAFILICSSFAFGYILFVQTNQEPGLSSINQDEQIPMIKKDRMDKVLDYFFTKEKKSTEILNSPAPIVDPSL